MGSNFQETCSRETKGEIEGKAKNPAGKDPDNIVEQSGEPELAVTRGASPSSDYT